MQIGLSSIILEGSHWTEQISFMCQHEVLKAKKVMKICQGYLGRRVAGPGSSVFTLESFSTLKASKHERKVN